MKTYSFLTSAGLPSEDNELIIPDGWNGVLYNDDANDSECVRESSLPKPGQIVLAYLDDRSTDRNVFVNNSLRAENLKVAYDPRRFPLCKYQGLDNGRPIWYDFSQQLKIHKRVESNALAMFAMRELVVAWLEIEFPMQFNSPR